MARHHLSQASAGRYSITDKRKHGRSSQNCPTNFDAFVASIYLPHARQRKRSWEVDERIVRQHLSATFGKYKLANISHRDVEIWLRGLSAKGLAPATCNRILAVLKSILTLARLHGLIPQDSSPCMGVVSFKVGNIRERYLTKAETRRLVQALESSPRPEATAILLLLLTGARKNEILKARWENIHLEQRLLTVPLSKSGKPRHIALSKEAIAVIRSIPRKPGCPWLFPSKLGGHTSDKPLADIYVFWNELRRRLGIRDMRIHDLRHSYASFLVNAGHSLYEVQKLLGHSDPRTTMRYAHLAQDSLAAAAQTVGNYLSRMRQGDSSENRQEWSRTSTKRKENCLMVIRPARMPADEAT